LLLLAGLAGFVVIEVAPNSWQWYLIFIWIIYLAIVAYKMRKLDKEFGLENYQRTIKPSYQITVFIVTALAILLYMLKNFWTTPDFFVQLMTQPIVWIPIWVYLAVTIGLSVIEIYVRTARDRTKDNLRYKANLPNVAFLRWSPGWHSIWDLIEVIATISIVQFVIKDTSLVTRLCGFLLVFVALTRILILINAILNYPQLTLEQQQEGYEG
jgi:hypothetical protein